MKTDEKIVAVLPDLAAIKAGLEGHLKALAEAQGAKDWTGGLGLAIGGIRTALHGLAGHAESQTSASQAEPEAKEAPVPLSGMPAIPAKK